MISKLWHQAMTLSVALMLVILVGLFGTQTLQVQHGTLTIKGIPVGIVSQALQDRTARRALFGRNAVVLHDRLDQLGIEAEIKAFYRSQYPDEIKLDQYIHQLFFNATGYVGDAYYVDQRGTLVLKQSPDHQFQAWFKLAYEAGLVTSSRQENGSWYVISPQGVLVPYETLATLFSEAELREMAKVRGQ